MVGINYQLVEEKVVLKVHRAKAAPNSRGKARPVAHEPTPECAGTTLGTPGLAPPRRAVGSVAQPEKLLRAGNRIADRVLPVEDHGSRKVGGPKRRDKIRGGLKIESSGVGGPAQNDISAARSDGQLWRGKGQRNAEDGAIARVSAARCDPIKRTARHDKSSVWEDAVRVEAGARGRRTQGEIMQNSEPGAIGF